MSREVKILEGILLNRSQETDLHYSSVLGLHSAFLAGFRTFL